MKDFTIISDPGIDDLVALLLLYKLSPDSQNSLVSSFGNVPENMTFQNAKEFVGLVAKNWKLSHGSCQPLNGKVEHPWPYYFHGYDGVWGVHSKVVDSHVSLSKKIAIEKQIISLAPLTDVYKILKGAKDKTESITVMGGVFKEEGNETKYAETNVAFDPEAAGLFFANCKGVKVKVVPLDVTRKVYWTEGVVDKIPETGEANKWIKKILNVWYVKYSHEREENFNLHDPLAIYLSFFPEVAVWENSGIKVLLNSDKRGKTEFCKSNFPCEAAMGLKHPGKISKEIFEIAFC